VDSRLVGAWRFAGFAVLAGRPSQDACEEVWQVAPSGDRPALPLRVVYGADGSGRLECGRVVEWAAGEPPCVGPRGRYWLHSDNHRLLVPVTDPDGSEPGFAFLFVREQAEPSAAPDPARMTAFRDS
jgi:hypothetical protein